MRVDCVQEQGTRPRMLASDVSVITEATAENECDYMGNGVSPVTKVTVFSEIFPSPSTVCWLGVKGDGPDLPWPST